VCLQQLAKGAAFVTPGADSGHSVLQVPSLLCVSRRCDVAADASAVTFPVQSRDKEAYAGLCGELKRLQARARQPVMPRGCCCTSRLRANG
jgi:hypothetical protein